MVGLDCRLLFSASMTHSGTAMDDGEIDLKQKRFHELVYLEMPYAKFVAQALFSH